jgi:hypothetical protein
VTYGKSVPTANTDPEIVRIRRVMEHFQIVMRPGAFLVDRVPLLRYWPGYGKQISEWHHEELELYRHQLRRVESEMVSSFVFDKRMSFISFCTQDQNKAGPSFTRTLLENAKEHQLSEDEMSYLAGSLFGAGSDTASHATNLSLQSYSFVVQTAVAITVAIMAAACYPAAQAKVHEELDAVIGSGRGIAKGLQNC